MRNSIYIFIAIICLLACGEKVNSLSIESPFAEEKEYEIEVINSFENTNSNILSKQTLTKIKFNVNSVSDTIIQGIWEIGETSFKDDLSGESAKELSQFRGIQLILKYNTQNQQISIANFEEVSGNLKEAFVKYYNPNGLADSSQLFNQINQQIELTTATEQDLLKNYFPEVKVLFSEINKDYVMNEKFMTDSFLPENWSVYAPIYSSAQYEENENGEIEITRKDTASNADFIQKIKKLIQQKHGEAAADTIDFKKFGKVKYEVEANIISDKNQKVSSIEIKKTEGNKTTKQVINILE